MLLNQIVSPSTSAPNQFSHCCADQSKIKDINFFNIVRSELFNDPSK